MNKVKAYFIFPRVHDSTEDDWIGSDIDIYIGGGGLYRLMKVTPSFRNRDSTKWLHQIGEFFFFFLDFSINSFT